jgi:hypothetical protein
MRRFLAAIGADAVFRSAAATLSSSLTGPLTTLGHKLSSFEIGITLVGEVLEFVVVSRLNSQSARLPEVEEPP